MNMVQALLSLVKIVEEEIIIARHTASHRSYGLMTVNANVYVYTLKKSICILRPFVRVPHEI